jgi:hypothetical protein
MTVRKNLWMWVIVTCFFSIPLAVQTKMTAKEAALKIADRI